MEVGSGTGNLSMKILERAGRLIAYELDQKLIAELQKRVIGTLVVFPQFTVFGIT